MTPVNEMSTALLQELIALEAEACTTFQKLIVETKATGYDTSIAEGYLNGHALKLTNYRREIRRRAAVAALDVNSYDTDALHTIFYPNKEVPCS
jgi:hypothetical protein